MGGSLPAGRVAPARGQDWGEGMSPVTTGTELGRGDVTSHRREDALGLGASRRYQQQFGLSTGHNIP